MDRRTTRHPSYALSQRIQQVGRLKTVAGWCKSRLRGLGRTEHALHLALAAYNVNRMPQVLA